MRDLFLDYIDPQAVENFKKFFPESDRLTYFEDKYEPLVDADALLIITQWDEFKDIDLRK